MSVFNKFLRTLMDSIMRNQSQRCFEGGVILSGNFTYNPLISFVSLRVQDSLEFVGFSIIHSSTKL